MKVRTSGTSVRAARFDHRLSVSTPTTEPATWALGTGEHQEPERIAPMP
jgi:hypothetical protein